MGKVWDVHKTVSAYEMYTLLGLSPQRLSELVTQQIIPKPKVKGEYALLESITAYCAWLRSQKPKAVSSKTESDAEKAKWDAEIKRMNVERMRGQLVPIEQVKYFLTATFGELRSRLLAFPSRLAPAVMLATDAVQAQQIVSEHLNEVMTSLKDPGTYFDSDEADSPWIGEGDETGFEPAGSSPETDG